jgi:anti-sigma regulatory factor (Ser/Thr protein kinase)
VAQELNAAHPETIVIHVQWQGDVTHASHSARQLARTIGFPEPHAEEIALAVQELAANLIRHAAGGSIQLSPATRQGRTGIEIQADDQGPGIPDVDRAITDGYSTAGGLGTGLGTVNRLMDELEIHSRPAAGTHIVCQRWLRPANAGLLVSELDVGAATRPYRDSAENGDALLIKQWEGYALAGVIDGLGHGQFAQRAAQAARHYVEQHFDQPLPNLFRGVERACRATRGVVMALVRFDLRKHTFTLASVGNVEVRLLGSTQRFNPIVRRGVIGLNAPQPVCFEHPWTSDTLLVLHSDGLRTHWSGDDFADILREPPARAAYRLLSALGKVEDDATVMVVRSKRS